MRWGLLSLLGKMTNTAQPAFMVYASAPLADVTGDSTVYGVGFDVEIFDQGSNYTPGTGLFVAPVTGKYRFSVNLLLTGLAAGHTTQSLSLVTSNRTITPIADVFSSNPFIPQRSLFMSIITDMDAGDSAYPSMYVSGATKVVDIYGHASVVFSYFCGELVA